ncbi:MAG: alpha/beta hydrolase [Planctomycetota bacterium]
MSLKATVVLFVMFFMLSDTDLLMAGEQTRFELLWPDGAPGAQGEKDADRPGVWVYPAEKPCGTAVIICPGGGYAIHATDHEGVQPAKYLNRMGVTAFVLRYRLAPYRHPVPLQDAQRAIRWVRSHADEFHLDPARVGIMGFSAGGHLTSTALTHFEDEPAAPMEGIDGLSSRPSFGILGYPVISFVADYSHKGSANNLLGPNAPKEQLENLSNDTRVSEKTPPVFLFHTSEDAGVPPQNSIAFYLACRKHNVPAELHVYSQGPHGVGLAPGHPALSEWMNATSVWLRQSALLTSQKRQSVKGTIQHNEQPLKFGTVAFIPEDPDAPVAWAMVRNGNYEIPITAGPVSGKHRVQITDQGSVAPGPTIEDARVIPQSTPLSVEFLPNSHDTVMNLGLAE